MLSSGGCAAIAWVCTEMAADDFTRVANQLTKLVRSTKHQAMSRVVLQGEALMKRETPVKTGTLRRSITGRVEQGGNRGVIGTNLSYARAVHEGTKPHLIKPKRAPKIVNGRMRYPALFWKGAAHPVRVVKHPGTKKNAFMTRTAARLRPIAEKELVAVFGKALARIS